MVFLKNGIMATYLPHGKMYFRKHSDDQDIEVLQIEPDALSIGTKTGSLLFTEIKTDWMPLDPAQAKWASNTIELCSKIVEIEIGFGITIPKLIGGQTDIAITVYNGQNKEAQPILSIADVNCSGVLMGHIIILGNPGIHPSDHRRKYAYRHKLRMKDDPFFANR